MEPAVRPIAWQPLTPRGVAAFAAASLGRVLLVQLLVALLVAGVLSWCLQVNWWPVVTNAIRQLPDQGQIRGGQLDWHGGSPGVLAENRFLALAVDLAHAGNARSPAHVEVEFGRSDFKVFSLFGYVQWAYPRGYVLACNRPVLQPWWGAWAPVLLALAALSTVAALFISWAALASVYSVPVWLLGFFANRELNWRGSWRLAAAGLMPGALFMAFAVVLYGAGILDPVRLLLAGGLHVVLGWAYAVASPFWLPRHPEVEMPKKNPFRNG